MCVFRGHMLQASSCRLPRGWQSGAAGKGGRENVDPPISDGLLGWPAGRPESLWATRRPGWAFLPQPRAWTSQREATSVGCPIPCPPSSLQGFKVPALLSRAKVGNQAPRWALVPPEGQGTLEEPVYCPPPPPSPLPAPLGTKQSLLSNFKCYLRTAWPQPKTALWKLAFRCRGCKYQRHTFGGGGCFDASPPSVAGAGPERAHRHTEGCSDRGTHTGTRQLWTTAHTVTHTTHILTHQGEGGVRRVLPLRRGPWDFSSW